MLQFIQRILNIVIRILGVVTSIQEAQAAQATATTADAILNNTAAILSAVENGTFGLAALQSQIATLQSTQSLDFTALSTQIAAYSPAGNVVQIAPIDTGGITAGLLDLIAVTVWAFPDPTTSNAVVDELSNCWAFAQNSDGMATSIAVKGNAPWQLIGGDDSRNIYAGDFLAPILDYTTILSSDATPVDWINRVFGTGTVFDGGSGVPVFNTASGHFTWIPWLDTGHFSALKRELGITPTDDLAPIWPGLAGVTLGTAVPISLTFTVAGPLQGVLVALTAVPSLKGHYDYDGLSQSLRIGALTFLSDNGDAEYVQALGFTNEVYVPKNMAAAASCKVRTVSGVTGTVTPFTIP